MKKVVITLMLQLIVGVIIAQHSISSRVINENKEGVPFATVQEENTDHITYTDENGDFTLNISNLNTTLIIASMGYIDHKIIIKNGKISNNIVLPTNSEILDAIVVTALGIERNKQSIVSSITEVGGDEFTTIPMTNILNSLSGQVSGVQITNGSSGVGSSSRIIIRGENSLSGKNQPLFVVDGVPISNDQITSDLLNNGALQEVDYGNGASEISPFDIESVSILKGAGSAALYGSRAANGVVLINTKDGKNDTKGLGISFSTSLTFETPLTLPDLQNEYGGGSNGQYSFLDGANAGVNDGGLSSFGPRLDKGLMIKQFDSPSTDIQGNQVRGGDVISRRYPDGTFTEITPTPWVSRPDNIKNFFETGITMQQNIALSTKTERGHVRLSYSNLRNKGMVPNTDLKRDGIALSLNHYLSEKLSVNTYINYINSRSKNRPNLGYGYENVMYGFTWTGRQANIEAMKDYWQAGQKGKQHFDINYLWLTNPYLTLYENTNTFNKDRVLGNAAVNYDITKNLRLSVRTGIDTYGELRTFKRALSTNRNPDGTYREDNIQFQEMNSDVLLSYSKRMNSNIQFRASVGANRFDQQSHYSYVEAPRLAVGGIYTISNNKVSLAGNSETFKKRINSVYGTGNIGFNNAIFVDFSVRNDWSSTLPSDENSFAYYSAGMNTHIDKLLSLPGVISRLNVRLSAASVGNDTEPYQTTQTYLLSDSYNSSFRLTNERTLTNINLRPERLNAYEIGIELWTLDSRLQLDASAYQNTSIDQIISRPVSSASGFTSVFENGGSVQTRGLDLLVSGLIIKEDQFQWKASVNYSVFRSIVKELPEKVDQFVTGGARIFGGDGGANEVFYIAKEGGRVGDMYGTGFEKIDGKILYGSNGLPIQDEKLRLLGNYNPDFFMGFGNEFVYKGFSLKILVDYREGGVLVSRYKAIASTAGILKETLPGREDGIIGDGVVNVGTAENPEYVPNTTKVSASQYYNNFYDRGNEESSVYDASYVKLRQVGIYYTFPQEIVQRLKLQDLRIGIIGSNLLLFTENPHFDPELNASQERDIIYGVEDASYPSARSLGFRLITQF